MSEASRLIALRARAEALRKASDATVPQLEAAGLLWWFVAHQEPDPNKRPPIGADEIEGGYFKVSSGVHAPLVPAAIFKTETGEWQASRGFRPVQPFDLAEVKKSWIWVAKKPISWDEYSAALDAGEFPNPLIGNNQPPEGIDELKASVTEQAAEAEAWFKKFEKDGFPDGKAADEAATRRDALNELFGAADKQRAAEKTEPWQKCQEIEAKWAFAKKAKAMADKLRAAIRTYGAKEQKKRDDAVRAQVQANTPIAEIVAPAPVRVQGAGGRAVPLPKLKPVCRVTDHAKALQFVKDRPEIKAAVATLVQQLYDAGVEDIPGTKIERAAA